MCNVLVDVDDFLLGLQQRQPAILFDSVRGVGRSSLDERSNRISLAGSDNPNFFGVARRLKTFARTLPRETFCYTRGDNRCMVFANDIATRLGLHRKFFRRA